MRILLLLLTVAVMAVSAATLKPIIIDNPMGFATSKSLEFAKGDNGDSSGWRECAVMDESHRELGVVCEGTRTLEVTEGRQMDVNYFCEFRCLRIDNSWHRVDYSRCQ
ncbi:MAG: hypothetical protein AB7F86_08195 [Bdellovibrionales bacterium]